MKRRILLSAVVVAVAALAMTPALAAQYHTGATLICSDCHTAHFSMAHGWAGGTVSTGVGALGGDWLGTTGPNLYLLKAADANSLCLACHDGQTFAPDVLGTNTNAASQPVGREAGALNTPALGTPYETWKGHTLGSTAIPPGYDPTSVGLTDWYVTTNGLRCIDCHAEHGSATSYRNLGPHSLTAAFKPTCVISTTNTTTQDAWIKLASYTAGSGSAATFAPYYDQSNVAFNRNDITVGTQKSSNKMDALCGACHGDFHGGPGDNNITGGSATDFVRHPNAQETLSASTITRYLASTTRVHVVATDYTGYTDASPTCVTCHKAHGNQNPFGLIFLNRNATAGVTEEGGYATGQTTDTPTGLRNLCGQCHGMGN